jgi:UDP-N-acetylglucosamine pyrophosphorylase
MAGGSASRLGLGIPKGLLKLKIHDKEISLFEIYLNELLEVNKKYNININLYIMTSKTNNEEIKKFFYDNNYFNYNSDNIKFFTQDELPILDIQGNLLLKSKNHVLFGPNGNGNVFNSLKNNGLLKDMYEKNIKYLLFSTIDNVLAKLVDLEFIGATICNNYELSSKTITKKDELEKDWIFCKYNNKPFMLPSRYITKDITNELDGKGNFIYREKNITYHLISIDLVNQFANINLKYHRAYKKNNYIDVNGKMVNSLEPNTFKFEQFIFDAFYYAPDMLLYRIKKDEFCPIKTKDDITKVQEFFEKNGK